MLSSRATLSCCSKVLISLNAGACMERHCGPSVYQCSPPHHHHPTFSALYFYFLSPLPVGQSNQRSTSTEANVWLDAINKTIIWDGLPSRPAQSAELSAMNHLDRGRPSRRQTLNISPVGCLDPYQFMFPFFLLCTTTVLQGSVSQQQLKSKKDWKIVKFKSGWNAEKIKKSKARPL